MPPTAPLPARRPPRRFPALNACSVALACLLAAPAGARAASDGPVRLSAEQERALGVRTEAARPSQTGARLVAQGRVALPPRQVAVVSTPVAGTLTSVLIAHADTVRQGQPLATLVSPQLLEWQREHQQAVTQEQLAARTRERDAALFAEGLIPQARAQASEKEHAIALAQLREKEQLLRIAGVKPSATLSAEVTVRAPASGTVVDHEATPGQRVEMGTTLFRIARPGELWVELQVPAAVARGVKVGERVTVRGCAEPGRVAGVDLQLDPANQTAMLRASFPRGSQCLSPNQYVEATLEQAPGRALAVPASALLRAGSGFRVYVTRADGYHAVDVRVTDNPAAGGEVTVEGGLAAGEPVVVQGTAALKGASMGLGADR